MTPSTRQPEEHAFEQAADCYTGAHADAPKIIRAFASSRTLAAAVPRVRIEELIEIREAEGRQLLFVPIPCRSQCFEIAHDLCTRLRVQIAAPGRPQNTIYNFAHNTLALQWLHCSIPRWFRQLSALDPTDREQSSARGAWFASTKTNEAPREIGVRVRSIPGSPRPSGARPAMPTVIAIGPARRVVRSESGASEPNRRHGFGLGCVSITRLS